MKLEDLAKLKQVKNPSFIEVLKDALTEMIASDADEVDYICGEFMGGEISISFKDKSKSVRDGIEIDGVNGIGYVLCFEDK